MLYFVISSALFDDVLDFIYVFSESKTTEQLEDEILVWALVTGGLGLILMVTVFLGKTFLAFNVNLYF